MNKTFKQFLLLPLLVIAAVAVVVVQVKDRAPAEQGEVTRALRAVEYIVAREVPFRARATAFGNVEPADVVNARSEVSGKIVYVHPDLEKGASVAEGTVVLRIEPTTFELSLSQSQAGLDSSRFALAQLETEEKTTRDALEIAVDNLEVGQKELERTRSMQEKNLVARSTFDKEVQKVLGLRQQVQNIEAQLATFESRKSATLAQIDQSQSKVAQSQDTLGRTEVRMPIDARIGGVEVARGEYITAGAQLFTALSLDAVEIEAQLPVQQFRPLVAGMNQRGAAALTNLETPAQLQQVIERMQLLVRVRLVGETEQGVFWDAQLARISESIDPVRDTMGLVVEVPRPYDGIVPGIKPPLLKGMSTSVEFFSPRKDTLVLPRKAVHQGRVYVAEENNELSIVPLTVHFRQGNLVIPDMESAARLDGRRIIISDVIPVMQGLPLAPTHAESYEQQLAALALGPVE